MPVFAILGVHAGDAIHLPKMVSWEMSASAGQPLIRRFSKLCEKTDNIGGYVFFCGGDGVGRTRRAHVMYKTLQESSTRKMCVTYWR